MQTRADVVSFVAAGILMVSGFWIAWSCRDAGSPPAVQWRATPHATSQAARGRIHSVGLHGEPIVSRAEAFASGTDHDAPVLPPAARDEALVELGPY